MKNSYKYLIPLILLVIISLSMDQKNFIQRIDPKNEELLKHIDSTQVYTNIKVSDIQRIKVAIIDTGFNYSHPNLNLKKINNIKLKSNDSHGTTVAGLIGSNSTAKVKYQGMIPGIKLYAYEIPSGSLNIESLSMAINQVSKLRPDVINVSLGTYKGDPKLYTSIQRAVRNGAVIVASAGNDSTRRLNYPASFSIPGVISVGSLKKNFEVLPYGNFNKEVDIFVPGENIASLGKDRDIEKFTGTSISTPIVTSSAILLKAKCPSLTPEQIESIIKDSANSYVTSWKSEEVEIRTLNVDRMLNMCKSKE